jgi:hypothetical protein
MQCVVYISLLDFWINSLVSCFWPLLGLFQTAFRLGSGMTERQMLIADSSDDRGGMVRAR